MNQEGKTLKNLGWKLINVPGDGTCGYHAIMYCLSKNPNFKLFNSIKSINPKPSNIELGNNLRRYMINQIDSVIQSDF